MKRSLEVWTVYDHPLDYPSGFVARRWMVVAGGPPQATDVALTAPTLEGVRDQLPPDLLRIERSPEDDPKIVESWL